MAALSPKVIEDELVELRSEDDVIFKVEDFYLKASCGTFRNMLSVFPITTGGGVLQSHSGPPIDVPAHSVVLAAFIELLKHNELSDPATITLRFPVTHELHGPDNSIKCLVAIIELMRWAECASPMAKRALKHFKPLFHMDPWTVYALAAVLDDIKMAKKAIEDVGRKDSEYQRGICPAHMALDIAPSVELAWLVGYWQAYDRASRAEPELQAAHLPSWSGRGRGRGGSLAHAVQPYVIRPVATTELETGFWSKVAQQFMGPAL